MPEECPDCPVYFCKISAPTDEIDKTEFYRLKEYIKARFSLTAIDKFGEINSQECIVIAFAGMQDLQSGAIFNTLVDKGLRCISGSKGESTPDKYSPHPIILIGMEDIMQDKSSENKKDDNHNILEILNLDPRFRFWDSSIWHRYVPLNENFETNFGNVFEEIKGYLEQGLYTTNVSREFLEFQTRMLVNSYLAPIGKGGHATDVTPYKFHSETAMKERCDGKNEELKKLKGTNLKWSFLLIDDYANAPLKPCNSEKDGSKTKQEIIESVLKEKVENIEICSFDENSGEQAVNLVNRAFKKLENKMYDIILLDYLLGNYRSEENTKQNKRAKRNRRELGSEFLEKLNGKLEKDGNNTDKQIKKNKGPLGSFWIFPISVFSSAMLDEIHQKGIGHISDNWFLDTGADPVNTPQLFRYNLYRFMNLQITTAPKDLSKFMKCLFPDGGSQNCVCKGLTDCYPHFIKLRSKYEILQNDVAQNSLFAKTIQKYLEGEISKAVWEHLTHLIYLLAHGSEIEWPEMWEEYNYVKQHFDKDSTPKEDIPEFMANIRDYIIGLKSK